MNRLFAMTGLVCMALLSSGCESLFGFGGPDDSRTPAPSSADLRGTIQHIDTQARTLTVGAEPGYQSNLHNENREVLSYDASTTVDYQGQRYRPEDLEVGDRIEARVDRSGSRPLARSITVVSDVSARSGPPRAVPSDFDATVRGVDTNQRTIELEPQTGDRSPLVIGYDSGTRVAYQGSAYRPEDLERGDQVRVRTRNSGEHIVADELVVTRSVSGGATGASAARQLRGTVSSIDTAARTIELQSVAWAQGFNPDSGASGTARVAYDSSTVVEYQGQRYGVGNLEPGDLVDVEVRDSSQTPIAQRIVVARSGRDLG